MTSISHIIAREILDSRGFPTVEAQVVLDNGLEATSQVPSGASTGSREALELRDKDPKRYMGKGVTQAVKHIEQTIAPALKGELLSQSEIDATLNTLDGTDNKQNLGANAILAVSMACAKVAAKAQNLPLYRYLAHISQSTMSLPVPMLNIVNGGAHADNRVDIQEFMILPCRATSFKEALRQGVETYHALKSVLKSQGLNTNVGDEGGFAPDLPSNEAALTLIMKAIESTGLKPGQDIYLGLDVAASEFYDNGTYYLASEKRRLSAQDWSNQLSTWVDAFPIISIEDGMDESDWAGWEILTQQCGKRVQLVGDDLFVTNTKIFAKGIEAHIANAILIKLNQIGTVTETIEAIQMAKKAGYNAIVSHRSGETEDAFIADLAVGLGVGQIKTGAPCRSERTAKYNQLLRIESQGACSFVGPSIYKAWGVQ